MILLDGFMTSQIVCCKKDAAGDKTGSITQDEWRTQVHSGEPKVIRFRVEACEHRITHLSDTIQKSAKTQIRNSYFELRLRVSSILLVVIALDLLICRARQCFLKHPLTILFICVNIMFLHRSGALFMTIWQPHVLHEQSCVFRKQRCSTFTSSLACLSWN